MTFILAATTRRAVWMLADRRLSLFAGGTDDNAVKLIGVKTRDGFGFIGYSGLGRTDLGCEPSEWLARTIRAHDLPMLETLLLLGKAAAQRIVPHLSPDTVDTHTFIASVVIGGLPQIYTICFEPGKDGVFARRARRYDLTKYTSPSLIPCGNEKQLSDANHDAARYMLKAYDQGKITEECVSKALNKVNHKVHLALGENGNVGERSIVMWKRADFTGGNTFYRGLEQDTIADTRGVPTIWHGMDVRALANVTEDFAPSGDEIFSGQCEKVRAEKRPPMEAAVAAIPSQPDDSLPLI